MLSTHDRQVLGLIAVSLIEKQLAADTVVICGDCLYPINQCEHKETGE